MNPIKLYRRHPDTVRGLVSVVFAVAINMAKPDSFGIILCALLAYLSGWLAAVEMAKRLIEDASTKEVQ